MKTSFEVLIFMLGSDSKALTFTSTKHFVLADVGIREEPEESPLEYSNNSKTS